MTASMRRSLLQGGGLAAALAAATLVPRAEAVGTSAGLSDGELGNRARRRLLPFRPWQRCANQPPMNWSFFVLRRTVSFGCFEVVVVLHRLRRLLRRRRDNGLGFGRRLFDHNFVRCFF